MLPMQSKVLLELTDALVVASQIMLSLVRPSPQYLLCGTGVAAVKTSAWQDGPHKFCDIRLATRSSLYVF
jgi:hypothetical protein